MFENIAGTVVVMLDPRKDLLIVGIATGSHDDYPVFRDVVVFGGEKNREFPFYEIDMTEMTVLHGDDAIGGCEAWIDYNETARRTLEDAAYEANRALAAHNATTALVSQEVTDLHGDAF